MEANKAGVVERLQEAKRKSGKTYRQLAEETGISNAYVAQLLRRQAQLKPLTAPKLREALPDLSEELLREMMKPPWRSYDPNLIQEPSVYSALNGADWAKTALMLIEKDLPFHEAVMHYAESIKEIINEEYGDGIMSAVDFNCSVDKVRGAHDEERVVVTFDGKFLPFTEQRTEEMASRVATNITLK